MSRTGAKPARSIAQRNGAACSYRCQALAADGGRTSKLVTSRPPGRIARCSCLAVWVASGMCAKTSIAVTTSNASSGRSAGSRRKLLSSPRRLCRHAANSRSVPETSAIVTSHPSAAKNCPVTPAPEPKSSIRPPPKTGPIVSATMTLAG
jgi:hypothetical protein